jgi:nucleotide-binding universal stress UspA family protein
LLWCRTVSAITPPFDQCITLATRDEFDPSLVAPWRAAMPDAWALKILLDSERSVSHALAALRSVTSGRLGGRTLAVLVGATSALATQWTRACSTLAIAHARPISTIIVGVGRPRMRSRTLHAAAMIAAATGARLIGVHRVESRDEARSTGAVIAANARVSVLGSARVRFDELRIEVAPSSADAIEAVARESNADVVVIGRRGSGGQVASAILRSGAFSTLSVV